MKYTFSLILVMAVVVQNAFSQGEDNNWIFGGMPSAGAGISFATDPPTAFVSDIHTIEGSASISDAAGNLLMYSDGSKVWNKEHMVMPDGAILTPFSTISTTQASVMVPIPGTTSRYYVFSL